MDYIIGKVISVEQGQIGISLINSCQNSDGQMFGVPDSMKVTVDTDAGPIPLLIGQPGSFVEVQLPSGRLLATVIGVKMQENTPLSGDVKLALEQSGFPVQECSRQVTVIPVGKFSNDGTFVRGTDILPTVNSNVYTVTPDKISNVYRSFTEGDFSIGTLSILPDQRAYINLDTMLGRHTAILGQTGGGKSWTVASILQKIALFPKATMLLLDLLGEYRDAFGPDAEYISARNI
jgi:hypothetical protein